MVPTDDADSRFDRRTVLQTLGSGAAVTLLGGVAAAQPGNGNGNPGGPCPPCPDGTRLLAKYEFEDDAFAFEEGACEDPFTDITYTNKEGEEGEPVEVSFTSRILVHDVAVKYGPTCELASESDDVTLTVDDEKDADGFEHTISIPSDANAISHFNACAGVCVQADFVVGDVIEELGEDGIYGDRLIAARWDGTATEGGDVVNKGAGGFETGDGDVVTTADGVTFDGGETTATVSFDVALDSEDVTLTLASYVATCPATFDRDTAHLQDLVDYETVTYTADGSDTLSVELGGLDWLDELCEN